LYFNGLTCINNCATCVNYTLSVSTLQAACTTCGTAGPTTNLTLACAGCCPLIKETLLNPCLGVYLEHPDPTFAPFISALLNNCGKINVVLKPNYLCLPCKDGVKSGNETDVDCGGNCTAKCAQGLHCATKNDCNGGACSKGGLCLAPVAQTTTAKAIGKNEYGIIVGVIGGVILLVGFIATWKWWIPAIGGETAYESAVSYTAANHEGIEMENVKSDRGVSVVDDRQLQSPTAYEATAAHEDDVYVS